MHDPGVRRSRPRAPTTSETDARVIGISPDPVEAVTKFADKYDLDFTLLADEDHAVADAYGTWVEKRCTARPTWACSGRPSSSTPTGGSRKVFPKVSPKTHDDVVLEALGGSPAA